MKVLMVCLGNICRSPLAEGILQDKINQKGLNWTVDSAGTGGWHAGEGPDPRSVATAFERGIDISMQRARKFRMSDFETFDHILVMDASNYTDVIHLTTNAAHRAKVELILNYLHPGRNKQVPDPYYGGPAGFDLVYEMLDAACEAFVNKQFS